MSGMAEYDPRGIENLRAAVVARACLDYLSYLRRPGKKIYIEFDAQHNRRRMEDEKGLVRWFHSKQFKNWCYVDGEKILEQLRENHKNGFRFFTDERLEADAKGDYFLS